MKASFGIFGLIGGGFALLTGVPLAPAFLIGLGCGAVGALLSASPIAAPVYHVIGVPKPVFWGGWGGHWFNNHHHHVPVVHSHQTHVIHTNGPSVHQPHIVHGAPALAHHHAPHGGVAVLPQGHVPATPHVAQANPSTGFFNLFNKNQGGQHSTVHRTAPGSAPSVATTRKDPIRGGTVHTAAPVLPSNARNVTSTRVMNPSAAPSSTISHVSRTAPSHAAAQHTSRHTIIRNR
jgi:hypothetical protein